MESEYIHIALNLLGVIVVMFVMFYLFKKLKTSKHSKNKPIKVLNTVSIGSKEKIILLKVNNTVLLVGATQNHIETLHVFNDLETAPEIAKDDAFSSLEKIKAEPVPN